MDFQDLAGLLRDRLRVDSTVPEDILERATNYDIIVSYIMCSCCGERLMNDKNMLFYVDKCIDDDDFLRLVKQHVKFLKEKHEKMMRKWTRLI